MNLSTDYTLTIKKMDQFLIEAILDLYVVREENRINNYLDQEGQPILGFWNAGRFDSLEEAEEAVVKFLLRQ